MSDLLLEIGCENLPPAAIRPAFEQLGEAAAARLDAQRLPYDEIYVTGTTRRLVLIVRGLATTQTSKKETVTGPPVSKAFDDDGNPTKAAEGFARSQGVDVSELKTVETERGDYVGLTRTLKAKRASSILKQMLPELIKELKFPKVMRWEDEDVRFARPIRWIVSLLGTSVVRFSVAGVKSGEITHVVPWIRRDRIRVRSADQYVKALGKAGVTLDHEERRKKIERLAKKAAERDGLRLVADEALIDELTFMLEDPSPLIGDFDRGYLKLPAEVVVTAMKSHQRYLAFRGRRGHLVPKFLTFTEGRRGSPATVRQGNEKVLKARLEDALFYWHEDIRSGMDGLSEKLGAIVFIEGLGSLQDKADRVGQLTLFVNSLSPAESRISEAVIRRASNLAKADLASEMIKDGKEFTLLQGLIGSYYAEAGDEAEEIVVALREQYMPRSAADGLPSTVLGSGLSIADRVDTIIGCFIAGLVPTGSQDPYALRRQANGLLRMLESRPWIALDTLLETGLKAYRREHLIDAEKRAGVLDALEDFFKTRVEMFLRERGVAYDVVAAVNTVSWMRPGIALGRARAFERLRGDASFELLITGAKRVGNILSPEAKGFGTSWDRLESAFREGRGLAEYPFDSTLFEDDAEIQLYDAVAGAVPEMIDLDARADFTAVLGVLSRLGPAIDHYFDRVLVNCPDSRLRENRHRYLTHVFALFSKYADFSCIVEENKIPAS